MAPNFEENATSQEQINKAEEKIQVPAAELLKKRMQNL